jgi:hypothetical protein
MSVAVAPSHPVSLCPPSLPPLSPLLCPRHLNSDVELRRYFGKAEPDDKRKHMFARHVGARGRGPPSHRKCVSPARCPSFLPHPTPPHHAPKMMHRPLPSRHTRMHTNHWHSACCAQRPPHLYCQCASLPPNLTSGATPSRVALVCSDVPGALVADSQLSLLLFPASVEACQQAQEAAVLHPAARVGRAPDAGRGWHRHAAVVCVWHWYDADAPRAPQCPIVTPQHALLPYWARCDGGRGGGGHAPLPTLARAAFAPILCSAHVRV